MGNAPDAVKARADYVTRSNEEDGWAQAVAHYILPRAKGG
jgi:hydroxymethylpyrimidine pyrophosphatase-like HAD family hydrolase